MATTNEEREMRVAVDRIVGFAKQFDEAHLNLACHAAFPLVLTPDLLYQIWAHFVPEAPWTAVARVLLSRLYRQVGYEMYEMDIAVRNLLLRELKEQFGQERLEELAAFLMDYVAQRLTEDDPDIQDLREAQEWTALAYIKPDEVARELALALSEKVKQEDMAEVLRLASLVENFAEPLVEAGFEPLLIYVRGIESFVRSDSQNAIVRFNNLSKQGHLVQVAGVSLPIPKQIFGKTSETQVPETQKPELVKEHTPAPTTEEASEPGNRSEWALTNYFSDRLEMEEDLPSKQADSSTRGMFIPNTRCLRVWGRDNLITKILASLTELQELPILSLGGGAGYGKTEAASQVAKAALHRNLFTDVLWVTARQTELIDGQIIRTNRFDGLNWNQFLDQIAHQLACPVERVQHYLKEEKYLVVLDNAETSQVEDILANLVKMLNPSRALLTSRLKTKASYVRLILIKGLEKRWSHRLLRDEASFKNIPLLIEASDEQLHRIHELSCGAPLALHFIVDRVLEEQALEPVLSALEQASQQVEVFYQFSLEIAWQRISDTAKSVLRYMGLLDAAVTWAELSSTSLVSESDWHTVKRHLKKWYLIEEVQDAKGNQRYDLHPWVRSSVRSGLVEKWHPSLQDLEQIAAEKFGIDL